MCKICKNNTVVTGDIPIVVCGNKTDNKIKKVTRKEISEFINRKDCDIMNYQ